MNEVKHSLCVLEQRCKLLRQQQVTFITALERCREVAHDRIKPVRNLDQVRSYLDTSCSNATDRRILSLFLSVCSDITDLCLQLNQRFNAPGANNLLEDNLNLLHPNHDFSSLRAKYPHDVINHLSCDEAKNFYGGVVSLIPIGMDRIREAVSAIEKHQSLSVDPVCCQWRKSQKSESGADSQAATQTTAAQTTVTQQDSKKIGFTEPFKPAWKPSGRFTR
uniref:Sperm acrosome associated 9 n=1 Tax=Leptobrachium leishanense TaxID=445787 RepID=A0A8C5WL62_9ANUR